MQDVTNIINDYRECVRHLWNTYFRMPEPTKAQIDAAYQFDNIARLLFFELVLRKIGKTKFERTSKDDPFHFLKVTLPVDSEYPVLISRQDTDRHKYWDDPVNTLHGNDADLRLIDCFDWEEFNYIDMQYYRVKIATFRTHPNLVGREALIEARFARVLYEETDSQPLL